MSDRTALWTFAPRKEAPAVKYDLKDVRVEEFKSGPREGERKPIALPKGAIPVGVVSGFGLRFFYLVPVEA
jgi:hypothetical protein